MRLLCALLLASVVGACGGQKTTGQPDAATAGDADAGQEALDVASSQSDAEASANDLSAPDDGAVACFPLFHTCAVTADCCGPYRCLNITGQPACQDEGPAQDAAQVPADSAADSLAGTASADAADGAGACVSLFHACTSNTDCCAPYRCLNITGQPACQLEGPATDGP